MKKTYLGKDDSGFRYWLIDRSEIYREWPNSGSVSDKFCSLVEWKQGKNNILSAKQSSRYVYSFIQRR